MATSSVESGQGDAITLDRRQVLTRLGVAGAVVWGAPLLAQTPAYAAGSECATNRVLSWDGLATGSGGTRRVALPATTSYGVDGLELDVTVSQTFHGTTANNGSGSFPRNRAVVAGPWGGVGTAATSFIMIYQSANNGTGTGSYLDFSFTKPVKDISFYITDIDYATGQYDDRVIMTPTFTRTNQGSSTITGTGTTGDAFYRPQEGNVADNSSAGTILVTYSGAPVTDFQIDFLLGSRTGGGSHAIFVSDVTFNSCT